MAKQSGQAGEAARRRDLRLRSLVATLSGIVIIGVLVVALPDNRGRDPLPAPGLGEELALEKGDEAKPVSATSAQQVLLARLDQHYQRALVMLHARRYAHALVELNRVLEIAPRLPEAYVNMGFALLGLERYQEAGHAFSIATRIRPDQANAYYGLAVALEAQDQLPEALGAMRTYLHRASTQDRYRIKAQSALWEWQATLQSQRFAPKQDVEAAEELTLEAGGAQG